jgi:hypothetical protein
LADFKLVETIPVESEALNMVSSGCDTTFIINFKITTSMLKGPVKIKAFVTWTTANFIGKTVVI